MIELQDIRNAYDKINQFVHRTPLIHSHSFSRMTGADVYIKAENLQKTGSFKVRGAFNKMLHVAGQKVIAASMGNHAQGVAFAAHTLGRHARIIMPVTAPITKEEATKGYGAEVILHGETLSDALNYAMEQEDFVCIHPFDAPDIIAGQGTIGLEIMDALDDVDCVLVPVGGGGLISGISVAIKELTKRTKVIGVQSESAQSAFVSFRDKKITDIPPSFTLADGIAVGCVGARTFEVMEKYVDDVMVVTEDAVARAILLFLERKKLVVEGAGAVPLAALIDNREMFEGKRVVLVASGGNIDFTLVDRIIHKGLVSSHRVGVFEVTVSDIPGSLHALAGVIASLRGNILNVDHDRLAEDLSVGQTRVVFTVETRSKEHLETILSVLSTRGYDVREKAGFRTSEGK
jgi:threonine dehydratase